MKTQFLVIADEEKGTMNYKVGQVIYVVFRKQVQLVPFRIIEEISRKTMQGNVKSYKIECGAQPGQIMDLSQIEGEIFTTAEEAHKLMLERATRSVNKIMKSAVDKAREWYSSSFDSNIDATVPKISQVQQIDGLSGNENQDDDDEPAQVILPDGSKARLRSVAANNK